MKGIYSLYDWFLCVDQQMFFTKTDICFFFCPQGPRDPGHGHGGPGFSKFCIIIDNFFLLATKPNTPPTPGIFQPFTKML